MSTDKDLGKAFFSFGIVADVQYADIDDGSDFHGKETRRYRNSLDIFRRAVRHWNANHGEGSPRPLDFVAQLGDLIDGKAGTHKEKALADVQSIVNESQCKKWVNCIGNHELYLFTRDEFARAFPTVDGVGVVGDNGKTYYSFQPHQGWRVVVLDPYIESIIGEKGTPEYERALQTLKNNNPNDVFGAVNWSAGLVGKQRRFLPYNGALGEAQRQWLKEEIQSAKVSGEKVIILTHVALHHKACKTDNVVWDYEETTEVLQGGKGTVFAVLSGHFHVERYHKDKNGIHHLSVPAPLLTEGDNACYAVAHVGPSGLTVVGEGAISNRHFPLE